MGPLTTSNGIEKMEAHIRDAKPKGGEVLCGGDRICESDGYFFQPTIVSDMTSDMLHTQEEIFGPLLGLYKFETENEVVEFANDTAMGLASYFFINDVSRIWRLLEKLEAGMIGINTGPLNLLMKTEPDTYRYDMRIGDSSAAETPFGGIKESG